jgi:hypothetical protein
MSLPSVLLAVVAEPTWAALSEGVVEAVGMTAQHRLALTGRFSGPLWSNRDMRSVLICVGLLLSMALAEPAFACTCTTGPAATAESLREWLSGFDGAVFR